jgi:hypothetical protein
MRRPISAMFFVVFLVGLTAFGQTHFRLGIFLHHSTGACIWGPNGSQVSVPAEITKYNRLHSLSGSDSVTMTETWWPTDDNEWATWHTIFANNDPSNDIRPFLASYPVVMIKSCVPSSNISALGTGADTLNPNIKSVANYKWHWRFLVSVMKERPQNFFIIWTNAPQVSGSTNASEAALSDAFCRWAKDTLARDLDPIVGTFPKNIFVFDFFHLLAGADGMLPLQLASGSSDSHPNASATALVAPQLVQQVFDAARAYESPTAVQQSVEVIPQTLRLEQNYPNPFNPSTTIGYRLQALGSSWVRLAVYDVLGQEVEVLVDEEKAPGTYEARFDASGRAGGVYFYRLQVRPLDFPLSGIPPGAGFLGGGTANGRDSKSGVGDPSLSSGQGASPHSGEQFVQSRRMILLR